MKEGVAKLALEFKFDGFDAAETSKTFVKGHHFCFLGFGLILNRR
jgi:hypothetical protein